MILLTATTICAIQAFGNPINSNNFAFKKIELSYDNNLIKYPMP